MLRPAGFSDDGSSDEDNFDEYPQKGGSIFGNQVNVTEEEKATVSNIVEDNGWDETKKATDLAIAKANLVEAIEAGNIESVRSLLEAVEVNTPLHAWGWGQVTASGLACGHGQHRVLELLVSEGGHCDGEGFMQLAAAGDDTGDLVECAKLLLTLEKESLNRVQKQGMTALMLAARRGKRPLVEWMVQHGAEVNRKDNRGWNALMFSVDSGHGDIARVLLDKGAKADHINHDGQTAADIAAGAERIELQDILETFTGDRGRLRRKQVGRVEQDSEIATLLKNFEMEHLIDVFKRENIDLEVFLLMKEANLSQLCSVGDTKRLLLKQAELHKAEWSRSSLAPISSTGQLVDCPASVTMVHNISQHARLMRLEVTYLRDQLTEHGERLLMAGADLVLPHVLLDQVRGAVTKTEELTGELAHLSRELRSYQVTSRTERANSVKVSKGNVSMFVVLSAGIIMAGCILCKVKK